MRDMKPNQKLSTKKKLKLALRSDITNLDNVLKKQEANLDKYKAILNEVHKKLAIKKSLLALRIKEWKQTKIERQNKENRYIADRKQRRKEEKVIRRVQTIVEERLATMKKFLRSKVNK